MHHPTRWTPQAKKLFIVLITLFFLLYLTYKPYDGLNQIDSSLLKRIFGLYFFVINQTLGIIHEGGHGVCYLLHCPQFMTALNGTLFQWGVPLGIALYYKRSQNLIAYYLTLFILAIPMDYTAWYISTSNQGLYLPASKSFLGVDGYHDFNYILSTLSRLKYYKILSVIVKISSIVLMFYAYFQIVIEILSEDRKSNS